MQYTTCFVLVECGGGVGIFVLHTTFPSNSHCIPQHVLNSSSLYPISFALNSPLVTYITSPQVWECNMSILGYFSDSLLLFYFVFLNFWCDGPIKDVHHKWKKKLNFEAPNKQLNNMSHNILPYLKIWHINMFQWVFMHVGGKLLAVPHMTCLHQSNLRKGNRV
jgi:hypothetical protein